MNIKQRIFGSNFVWRLSGLSYYTGVLATRGHYLTKDDYLKESFKKVSALNIPIFEKKVLEFGSGLGGNLISIAKQIKSGIGIDINPLFVYRAKKLARRFNCDNLTFLSYDGFNFPSLPKFDVIFSVNVFERIPKNVVKNLIPMLVALGDENSIFVLFFLNEYAQGTQFTELLSDNAYVYWTHDELSDLFSEYSMNVEISPWGLFERNAYLVRASRL